METKTTMRATMPATQISNAINYGGRKEQVGSLLAVGKIAGELLTIVDARFYMSRSADGAGPVYCSIWVQGSGDYVSGNGTASGYGYHKQSAALASAIARACGAKGRLLVIAQGV